MTRPRRTEDKPHDRDYQQHAAEQAEWAASNTALVAAIRARLAGGAP